MLELLLVKLAAVELEELLDELLKDDEELEDDVSEIAVELLELEDGDDDELLLLVKLAAVELLELEELD